MSSNNNNLRESKKNKNDEFYTRYEDIEKEMQYYINKLNNKVIYCNCDNPIFSNFYKYFKTNFKKLKLKKLIATYCNLNKTPSIKTVYDGKNEIKTPMKNNGDFRNQECIDIMLQSDIVITNPPFSLFYEYVSQLMNNNKQFIILGNLNAVTNKKFFPYIQNNKIWFGMTRWGTGNMWFITNDTSPLKPGQKMIDGIKYQDIGNSAWFTNIPNERLTSYLFYKNNKQPSYYENKNNYNFYDNYNALNIDKVKTIPFDYYQVMGVPVTFLSKYNPEEFEIIGCLNHYNPNTALPFQKYGEPIYINKTNSAFRGPVVNGKAKYFRILIKRK